MGLTRFRAWLQGALIAGVLATAVAVLAQQPVVFPSAQHVIVDTAPTTAVTGTFWQTTQPVSGTVTANQGGAPWSQNLTQIGGSTLTLGQQTAANSIPVILPSATVTTLTPPSNTGYALDASLSTIDTDLKANIVLKAGANIIGKVGIDQTTPGTTNAVQANAGTNLNTSALALESGGHLANIDTDTTIPSTIFDGHTAVTTCGTRVTLAASTAVASVTIKALVGNTGHIYVGNASVSSSNGFVLEPGDTVSFNIANLNTVNLDCSVNGEGVSYVGVK